VKLPDGSAVQVPQGTTVSDVLARFTTETEPIAAMVNGRVVDIYTPLTTDAEVAPVLEGTEQGLEILRHSSAHLMAQAVNRLFDNVEFAIGPVIEDGFYYDFDLPHVFSPEDLEKIEAEMERIRQQDLPIRRIEMSKQEALEKLSGEHAKFKTELLEEIQDDTVSFYNQGEFTDWCRGPHLPSTGKIRAFKLTSIAGAYWRGDERREMLQRIYATAWWDEQQLKDHLARLEEARKRDHRKLGKELKLFAFHPEAPGFPFFHARGVTILEQIEAYMRARLDERGYQIIRTPLIMSEELWHRSGHWDHYKDNMYFTNIEDGAYAIKPMNCPGSTFVYRSELRSYRNLPLRLAEFGHVHRYEKSGVLTGLFRVRSFTIDDAHHYCTPDQIQGEVSDLIELIGSTYRDLGFTDFSMELSTRPEDRIGSDEIWDNAEHALREALQRQGAEFKLCPGEGAFYGPKIDFHVRDSLKRTWQLGTVQVDFSLAERFDLSYIGPDGNKARPVLVHRAILGSFERVLGILVEHYGGAFPAWLAPLQAVVIPVSSAKFGGYARQVAQQLGAAGLRAEADLREESLNYRIRDNRGQKIPYMLIVGGREAEAGTVSVRRRDGEEVRGLETTRFIELLGEEVRTRSQQPMVGA
jgi:threonyl-tRNA synthetase